MCHHVSLRPLARGCGALTLALVLLGAGAALAQVANSKHDFSVSSANGVWASPTETRICVFCHAPARATTQHGLWNRNNPVGNFILYSSPTLNAAVGQPGAASLKCLACHDGTQAIDAFGSGAGGDSNVNDLSDDHPFSFIYDSALAAADHGLHDPLAVPALRVGGALPLYNRTATGGVVECATCHDVHNWSNGLPSLLRLPIAGSQLCIACHKK